MLLAVLMASEAKAQPITTNIPPYDSMALPGPRTAGRAFLPGQATSLSGVAIGAANRLYAAPLWVGNTPSIAKTLSFNISTGNASAWNAEACLYADNGTGIPGALIADSGQYTIGSGSVTGVQTSPTLNSGSGVAVQGWVWVAFMASATGASVSSINNSVLPAYQLLGSTVANAFAVNYTTGVFGAQTFGACPATFPAVSYNTAAALPAVAVGF